MYVQQIYTGCLSQASYYIESDGQAAIIDPVRDIDAYLEISQQRKTQIRYIFLTHFHADFVSGQLDLAKATGAVIVFGPRATPRYYTLVATDHELFKLGSCKIEVLHTPGHTVESTCFLLYDPAGKPYALLSGDTLFIGDVGRPDLLSGNLSAEELALMLYDSIQAKVKTLPDDVIVYPGHGAGSACGKNLSKETVSTIGAQRKENYAMTLNREDFVEAVTTDQPFAPAYFFKDARINMTGSSNLDDVLKQSLLPLTARKFRRAVKHGAVIIDTRPAAAFAHEFIKGAINIGLDGQFASWVGTLVHFDQPLVLLTEPGLEREAIVRLARVGYEKVQGYLAQGISDWKAHDGPTGSIRSLSLDDYQALEAEYILLDLRRKTEYEKERMSGTLHIPLEQLHERMRELNKNKCYAVFCAGGYRSMIAASILKKNGFEHIINIEGGIAAIKKYHPEYLETV